MNESDIDTFQRKKTNPCFTHVQSNPLRRATVALVAVSSLAVLRSLCPRPRGERDASLRLPFRRSTHTVSGTATRTAQGSSHSLFLDAPHTFFCISPTKSFETKVTNFFSQIRLLAAFTTFATRGFAPVAYRFLGRRQQDWLGLFLQQKL